MTRLNQLVTRLLIIALLALACWVGRDNLVKSALEYHLESRIGSRVDVRHLQLNTDESSVILSQVEVASPIHPRKNLLQFEAASLNLDFDQLQDRRIVVKDGRLSEVKFGAPRTTSGQLERGAFDPALPTKSEYVRPTPAGTPGPAEEFVSYSASQRLRDSLVVDLGQVPDVRKTEFETAKVLKERSQQWVSRFRAPQQQLIKIDANLSKAENVLAERTGGFNPLRSSKPTAAVDDSQQMLKEIGLSISDFEAQLRKDVYELSQIQIRDRQTLVSAAPSQKFNEKVINEILVGEVQRQLVANSLAWFQQFRDTIPDPQSDFLPVKRGRDFMFGKAIEPRFEILELEIDGEAEFANSHFSFAGTIQGVSDVPSANDHPVTFSLRAQGDPQVVVSGTLNRTGGENTDTIKFTGHSIEQPAFTLGSKDSIQLSMTANSKLHVESELTVTGEDQLGGTLTFTFEDVMLHADAVHASAGGTESAARLNETVSSIRSFQITTTLGGTIYQPTASFASDLGEKVASSLEAVYSDAQQLALRKREHLLNRTIDEELEELKKNIANGIAKLNESWRANYDRLNRLKVRLNASNDPRWAQPQRFQRK